jgi:hypothetical protein
VHLHAKSGSPSPLKHFAYDMREIVRRQTLPGYRLVITHAPRGAERLNFAPIPIDALCEAATQTRARSSIRRPPVNHRVLSGTATVVPSRTRSSCYRGPESELTPWRSIRGSLRNFPNLESFGFLLTDGPRWRAVENTLTARSRRRTHPARSFRTPFNITGEARD